MQKGKGEPMVDRVAMQKVTWAIGGGQRYLIAHHSSTAVPLHNTIRVRRGEMERSAWTRAYAEERAYKKESQEHSCAHGSATERGVVRPWMRERGPISASGASIYTFSSAAALYTTRATRRTRLKKKVSTPGRADAHQNPRNSSPLSKLLQRYCVAHENVFPLKLDTVALQKAEHLN